MCAIRGGFKPLVTARQRRLGFSDELKPYAHAPDYKKHARDYLSWEVALVEQIKRDPTIRFSSYQGDS